MLTEKGCLCSLLVCQDEKPFVHLTEDSYPSLNPLDKRQQHTLSGQPE